MVSTCFLFLSHAETSRAVHNYQGKTKLLIIWQRHTESEREIERERKCFCDRTLQGHLIPQVNSRPFVSVNIKKEHIGLLFCTVHRTSSKVLNNAHCV